METAVITMLPSISIHALRKESDLEPLRHIG